MKKPPLTKAQKVIYTIIILAIISIGYFDYIKPANDAQAFYELCLQTALGGKNPYTKENTELLYGICENSRKAIRACQPLFFRGDCDKYTKEYNFVKDMRTLD